MYAERPSFSKEKRARKKGSCSFYRWKRCSELKFCDSGIGMIEGTVDGLINLVANADYSKTEMLMGFPSFSS